MTSDESALLAAIEVNPVPDLPRLVYADWLDEHDQPIRAEFIRLQCEIDSLTTDRREEVRAHHAELWDREAELLAKHRAELRGPLAGLPGTVEVKFHRGFVRRVVLRVSDFLAYSEILAVARPRPELRVDRVLDNVSGFLNAPHLDCVTEVGGYTPGFTEFFDWADMGNLRDAGTFTRLEILDLEGCSIGDWFGNLFRQFTLPALDELDLSNNHISDVGVSDLLNCRLPRKLILGGNPITDQGAIELADRLRNSPVEYLNLRRTLIERSGHSALLNAFPGGKKKVDLF